MATVVLQTVGAAVGTALGGPIGGAIGQTLGAIAGTQIDQRIFGPDDQTRFGPRLETTQTLTARQGNPIPRIFGTTKISGEIIWATRFEEVASTQTQKQGGKGASGPKTTTTTYSYFGNFAIGLCEGKIAKIGRIWIDGKVVDKSSIDIRVYLGDQTQLPDPLIEAKQGQGAAPAYRGLSYVVFDGLPLADYGNRIPQVAVEVMKPVGAVAKGIRAVNMIPGATEFGYDTQKVEERISRVEKRGLNVNQSEGVTDFLASLDDLQAQCPNLEQVSLVVTWFGSDLRADQCRVEPKVEVGTRDVPASNAWSVAGLNRNDASLVSQTDGELSFGGTPSDSSVLRAIAELKARGLRVGLNPFLMMDIPPTATLPSPYGLGEQPAFPWRGRITCNPSRDQANTVDQSAAADDQINKFVDNTANGTLFNYRSFIKHYAALAAQAGGVDLFIIGSEMRGLTSVRNGNNRFPFVDALAEIAGEVRPDVGSNCIVTYGADWSEYFGLQASDESGDISYNLDSLWADANIDAIGIDNYLPLSDWREDQPASNEGAFANDLKMFKRNIAGGEGYDWFYATVEDRAAGTRTEITDGLGKPWVYRTKDLASWWSNQHYDRVNGMELVTPTAWVPEMKPIIFTEFGAPAVHNGAAQPNVFYDPKSSENALPYFSNGGRDDQAQANYLLAHQEHWDPRSAGFVAANNPVSSVFNSHMVDFSMSQVWAWDARPFPAFPNLTEVWSDAENWYRGHWLNGRIGTLLLSDLIVAILEPYDLQNIDVSGVAGWVDGYVLAETTSARRALEALLNLYSISVFEDAGRLVFSSANHAQVQTLNTSDLVQTEDNAQPSITKAQHTDLPHSVTLAHLDSTVEYNAATTEVQRTNGDSIRQTGLSVPIVSSSGQITSILERWLNEKWTAHETVQFSLSRTRSDLTLSDTVVLPGTKNGKMWEIVSLEEGIARTAKAKAVDRLGDIVSFPTDDNSDYQMPLVYSASKSWFLDLPILPGAETIEANRIAVSSSPWPGDFSVFSSPTNLNYSFRQSVTQQATTGQLLASLAGTNTVSRWQYGEELLVELDYGQLSSVTKMDVFRGVNALALRSLTGTLEIVQFCKAELIGPNQWRLSRLLRGQLGSEKEAKAGAEIGADVVLIDGAVEPLQDVSSSRGLALNWKIGPNGSPIEEEIVEDQQFTIGYRGFMPFSPVHLNCVRDGNGLNIDWKRRNRLQADDWAPLDIPMSEEQLGYTLQLTDAINNQLTRTISSENAVLSSATLTEVFGQGEHDIDVSVAQHSTIIGTGPATSKQITISL